MKMGPQNDEVNSGSSDCGVEVRRGENTSGELIGDRLDSGVETSCAGDGLRMLMPIDTVWVALHIRGTRAFSMARSTSLTRVEKFKQV